MSIKLESVEEEEGTLCAKLKELDAIYKNAILILEQRRQQSLQATIDKINNNASECRRKMDSEYWNEREIIQQKLFKLKMESYLKTHHQQNQIMQDNVTVTNGKRKITDIMNENNNNNIDNEEDSDVIIMESPPPKKHKPDNNTLENTKTINKTQKIIKKSRFEESESESDSDGDGSSPSKSETCQPFKKNKKRIINTRQRKKKKQPTENEQETETETETDYESDYNETKKVQKRSKSPNKVKLNPYYSAKQRAVTRAQKRFKQFKKRENGKIIITLPISTVCSEYAINSIFVTNFGKIPHNQAKADKYCDEKYIYPIGFEAYRIHLSYKDPGRTTKYFMKICDNGMKGPIYEVYAQDDKKKKMRHTAATQPWQIIIDKISRKAKKNGYQSRKNGYRETNGTSGPRYLGLRDYLIMGIVELLPNALKCKTYWTAKKHKHNLPPKPFFTGMHAKDIMVHKQK